MVHIATLILLVLNVMTLCQAGKTNRIIQRGNYGVLFRPVSEIRGSEQYWRHTFELELPSIPGIRPSIPDCAKLEYVCESDLTCKTIQLVAGEMNALHENYIHDIHTVIQRVRRLIPETQISTLGAARRKDLSLLQDHIKDIGIYLSKADGEFQTQQGQMSSIMSTVDKRVAHTVEDIFSSHEQLTNLSYAMEKELSDSNTIWVRSMLIIVSYQDKIRQMQRRMFEVMEGVNELTHDRLSPYLISTDMLKGALEQVQEVLSDRYPNLYIVHSDPEVFYQHTISKLIRFRNSLFITIDIPVVSGYHKYLLYEILTIPVPITDSTNHSTLAVNLPDYIGLDLHANNYIEVDEQQYRQCTGHWEKHCPSLLSDRSISSSSCALAILFNAKGNIMQKCDFVFQKDAMIPSIIEIAPGNLLVSNIKSITLECEQGPINQNGCKYCIISIPCSCAISADPFIIPERINNCNRTSRQVTKNHLINLAMLQNFFEDDTLNNILGDTTFDYPVEMQIPDFRFYEQNFTNLMAVDNLERLNLKGLIEKVKRNETVYLSLSESFLDREWTNDDDWSRSYTRNILIVVNSCISASAIILCTLLAIKVRALTRSVTTQVL